jgi:hypothetical protein
MRVPEKGAPRQDVGGDQGGPATSSVASRENQVEFLRRRFAAAILKGDDSHAEVIRQLLDRLLNEER